jgi:hypothetical protein
MGGFAVGTDRNVRASLRAQKNAARGGLRRGCVGKSRRLFRGLDDLDPAAGLVELDDSVLEGEERPIATGADILAGMQFRAALADENVARDHGLAAEFFDPETL